MIPGSIHVLPVLCYVSDDYCVTNITGDQLCFRGAILSGVMRREGIFPISLFNGKKEQDRLILYYKHKDEKFIFNVICYQTGCRVFGFSKESDVGSFEEALYTASYTIIYKAALNNARERLIAYNTHVNYAKAFNLSTKLKFKSYEPILLLDYIYFNCMDINGLIKLIYYDLFIHKSPILSVIND